MRRTWFLLGLTTGLVIALQPVFTSLRDGIAYLAAADDRVRERNRLEYQREEARLINERPVGWGETIDTDGTETAPMQERA